MNLKAAMFLERGVDDVKEMEPNGIKQVENCVKIESSNQVEVVNSEREVKDLKLSGTNQMEKPQFKSSNSNQDDSVLISKKKSSFSSSMSLSFGRATKLLSTPAKPATSSQSKKESNATPINKKSALNSADKRKSTPKSIYKSVYFISARESNRLTSTNIRKSDGLKVMDSNFKSSKDCSTPLRTPITESVNGVPKHPLSTSSSENRRDGTPHDSTSGRKTVQARWNFLPTETKERAARRKKLEEKFNANQTQKLQEQVTLKAKAETEIRKLRHTLCFKARPLPDFHKERATPNSQMKKDSPTQPQSPKLMLSTVQRKPSTPRQRPPTKAH